MSAMKRELERLAEIVIYGNAETIQREFDKLIREQGGGGWIAGAIEFSRAISPLCQCGADYHEQLMERFPEGAEKINAKATNETK